MKKLNIALSAAALMTTGLMGGPAQARSLSDADAVRLSYAALQANAARYGISNPTAELRVRQIVHDSLQQTHVRMDQVYRGLPVDSEQLITHFDRNGRLIYLNGEFAAVQGVSVRPTISGLKALEIAQLDFAQGTSEQPVVQLRIHVDEDGVAGLAYYIKLVDIESASPAAWTYFIDAHTGDIRADWDSLETDVATGVGHSLYLGTVSFGTDSGAAGFTMTDTSRGGMYATDMMNGTSGNGNLFKDVDNDWGDGTNKDRASAGVDAFAGVQKTWDFYKNVLGRNGIKNDGKGSLARVHYSSGYVNAFWDDGCFCMTYGDGDGVTASPLVSIDVAGHEMTHGVTSATAGLNYSGQSGGLNESYSDIMGTMVEYYAASTGVQTVPDYWIGEDIWTPAKPADALRYMDDPSKDGRSIDNANKMKIGLDVHYSSGVQNNVFFLASEGGTNKTSKKVVKTGIGNSKAAAIWYRALVTYLRPKSNWSDARAATIKSATDLYTQAEADVVAAAWDACGVNK